jgi:hypothetical protein
VKQVNDALPELNSSALTTQSHLRVTQSKTNRKKNINESNETMWFIFIDNARGML